MPEPSDQSTPGPTWVVIPTYDEAGNIERVVEGVAAQLGAGDRILVVDDASPDGTGHIADRLAASRGMVEVLHRPSKSGLGSAYVDGFGMALAGGASRVVQMDADLSHDPADLPALFGALDGADLVIGSRYVPGGGVEAWGPARRVLSRGGSLYSRLVLGLPQKDLTGGYKCWRAEALRRVHLERVDSTGYAFQVELTYRAVAAGLTVVEIPILFRERTVGRSKMTASIVAEAAWRVPALRFPDRPSARIGSR